MNLFLINGFIKNPLLRNSLVSAMLMLVLTPLTSVESQAQASECGQPRKVGTRALDEASYKQLNKVYEDVGEEKYDEAFAQLQKMLARVRKDVYLDAVLSQAMAQVEWSRENFDAALIYFERTVELNALPDQPHFALMYQIAQLYFMKERYDDALERLELWYCTSPEEKITADSYVLKASIYAQKEGDN